MTAADPEPLALALAEIELRALAADGEARAGWRHATLIIRLGWGLPAILRQLRRHAAYFQASNPSKAAAYREAGALVAELTGAVALPEPPALLLPGSLFDFTTTADR